MNMQNLMLQAKKMQRDMEKAQKEIESKEYIGKSQAVTAVVSGNNRVVSVKIDMDDFSIDDKDLIQDMVMVAVNDAIRQIEDDKKEKFGKYGQMFNGLM